MYDEGAAVESEEKQREEKRKRKILDYDAEKEEPMNKWKGN